MQRSVARVRFDLISDTPELSSAKPQSSSHSAVATDGESVLAPMARSSQTSMLDLARSKESVMDKTKAAEVGDLIVITGHRVGETEQVGEILEVLGEPPSERYRVRWGDDHESVFYPGSDATIRHATHRRASPEEK
jgi:hypothetical protein